MQENPGYDAGAYWAASGLQDYMRPDEDAAPPRFPGGIGDHTASMQVGERDTFLVLSLQFCQRLMLSLVVLQLFGGIALALFHRKNTGEGTLVDVKDPPMSRMDGHVSSVGIEF